MRKPKPKEVNRFIQVTGIDAGLGLFTLNLCLVFFLDLDTGITSGNYSFVTQKPKAAQ